MSLFDKLGLDPNIDRNSFTKEQAAKVFEEAASKLRSGEATEEILEDLLDTGFTILQIIAMLA